MKDHTTTDDRMKRTIDPERFYSLYAIVSERLIPGVDTYSQMKAIVNTDSVTNRVLHAVQLPRGGNGIQYKIKGENIIQYLVKKGI